jgi:hypothetical protein
MKPGAWTPGNVVCPSCDGTGAGWAAYKGLTSSGGVCPDCAGVGDVSPMKRARLLAAKDASDPDGGVSLTRGTAPHGPQD